MIARRLPTALATAAIAAAALTACGESKEDKATKKVCDARSDIAKQVDTLSGLTLSTATTDQVSQSLKAIGKDLSTIADAQTDLSDKRRQEIESANAAFASQVRELISTVGRSTSLSNAQEQLKSATKALADTYKQTYAKVDCST